MHEYFISIAFIRVIRLIRAIRGIPADSAVNKKAGHLYPPIGWCLL
jgi:hypothetical protein